MWSKILLITELLVLVLIAVIIWHFDYEGMPIVVVICIVAVSIFITGFVAIRKSRKSVGRADTNIEASHESMIESDPNVTGQVSRRLRSRNASTMSDESVVLQQSDFMPHTVSAIIENENKPRDSLISNNELPPSYEEAKNLPILSLKA